VGTEWGGGQLAHVRLFVRGNRISEPHGSLFCREVEGTVYIQGDEGASNGDIA